MLSSNNSCPSPPHYPSYNQVEAMSDRLTSEWEQHPLPSPLLDPYFDPTPSSSSSSTSSSSSVGSISSCQNQSQQKKEKKKRKKVMMKPKFVQLILTSPRMVKLIKRRGSGSESRIRSWLNELSPPRLYCVAFALSVFGNFKRPALKGSGKRGVIGDKQQCFGTIDSSVKSRGLRTLSWVTQMLSKEPDFKKRGIKAVSPDLLESITDRYGTWSFKNQTDKEKEAGKPRELVFHPDHEGLPLLINQFHLPAILIETRIVIKGEQPRQLRTFSFLRQRLSQHPNFNTKRKSWDLASLLKFWCKNNTPKTPTNKGKKHQLESDQEVATLSLINISDLCDAIREDGMEVPSDLKNLTPLKFTLRWLRANMQADQEIIAALNEWLDSGDTAGLPRFPPDKVRLLQKTTQNTAIAAPFFSSSSSSIPTTPVSEEGENEPLVGHSPNKKPRLESANAAIEPQSFPSLKLVLEPSSDMMNDDPLQDESPHLASLCLPQSTTAAFQPAAASDSFSQLSITPNESEMLSVDHDSHMTGDEQTEDRLPSLGSPCSSPSFCSTFSSHFPPFDLNLNESNSAGSSPYFSSSSVNSPRTTSPTSNLDYHNNTIESSFELEVCPATLSY